MKRRCAFTLVELLVVISIIAMLLAVLMPSLNKARNSAKTAKCLSNMRNMQLAHWLYMTDNNGWFINAGLAHGGSHANEAAAWINTLQQYYQDRLLIRCPSDNSPHWPVESGGRGEYKPTPTAECRKHGRHDAAVEWVHENLAQPVCMQQLQYDLTGDCRINLADFAKLLEHWLECNLRPDDGCF